MQKDKFADVDAVIAKTREVVGALRGEHNALRREISDTEAEIERQKRLCLPFADMKSAIVEMLAATGQRFESSIRAAVADLARHKLGNPDSVPLPDRLSGKPMTFAAVETIIAGELACYEHINLLRAGRGPGVFDAPLFFLFGEAIAARLRAIMDGMTPEEFGYDKLNSNEIGCGLQERRSLIPALEERLADLISRRDEVSRKLVSLGYQFPKK